MHICINITVILLFNLLRLVQLSLTHPVLITAFYPVQLEGHQEPRNKVESQNKAEIYRFIYAYIYIYRVPKQGRDL